MKDATRSVPVSLADFRSVDHLGSVFVIGLVPGEHASAVRSPSRAGHHLPVAVV